ncbi:hypothetical protein [Fodinicola acaciae]|uniref:hypothetical protein n=1 Tax=Fodinicola acaciae TaxID=2681555 RepID=UPI0013D54187|nr:hypothetical protein [Fodinicola acaciae]
MKRDAELPALTRAEQDLIDSYLGALRQLGRANPARATSTYGVLTAAQALVAQATALRDALVAMTDRGETDIYPDTMARALRVLGVDELASRTTAGR